jgi:prophage regulatory protein
MHNALIRLPVVLASRGRSKTAHYDDIASGLFPRGVAVGPRSVAWPAREVEAVNAARIAGRSNDEIRALVRQLEAARAEPQ